MSYTYRYISAQKEIQNKTSVPKDEYINMFQETVKEQFYNSSDWWTISEETAVGLKEYKEVDARVLHLINAETGLKLGDDWKTLLFPELDHNVELGKTYLFNGNVWLTTNTEKIKNLSSSCTIRRCNNTLRWVDEKTGAYYEEPCCIEYLVKEPRDYATQGSPFMIPGGFLHIDTQLNSRTGKIKENQRFLFGSVDHWTGYKVVGTGLNDFRNEKTYDNNSAKILTLDLIANFVNDQLDDVILGIADVYTNVYSLSLNKSQIEGIIGSSFQLSAVVVYNGKTEERPMTWETSGSEIARVQDGLVTFISSGSAVITAGILNNPTSASALVVATVSPVLTSEIVISPSTNYVLEGATKVYSVYLYQNGAQQANPFVITCENNNVPFANYDFSQVGINSFQIKNNLRSTTSYLTITCTSGLNVEQVDINLRGGW